jgi:YVTN family beta-propeller protein
MRAIFRCIRAGFSLSIVLCSAGAFLAVFVTAGQVKYGPGPSREANDGIDAASLQAPVRTTFVQTPCPAISAYITNFNSNTVSVIDTSDDTLVATVNVGSSPLGVAVKADGTRVYVANNGDNTVSVIDVSNNTVVATLELLR